MLEASDHRHDFQHLPGLQQKLGGVGSPAHGDRELQLPAVGALARDDIEQGLDLVEVAGADLGVDRHGQPSPAERVEGRQRRRVTPPYRPQVVVGLGPAVDRHRDGRNAHVGHRLGPLGRDAASTRGHRGVDATLDERRRDLQPVFAQVRFPADQGDVLHPQVGHLGREVERLGGGQLVGASSTRA